MSSTFSQTYNPGKPPERRQILAVLGNRHVVFGSTHDSGTVAFSPEHDSVILPRVSSMRDMPEARLIEHLKVDGYQIVERPSQLDDWGDLMLQGPDGARVLIDLKFREDYPTDRELNRLAAEVSSRNAVGESVEVWRFSSDRLSLVISSLEHGKVRHDTLVPLNVWEATTSGIFDRARVLNRVSDWEERLATFFSQITEWIVDRPTLSVDQTRTVTMSEELMRNFAVPDRELPILDVLESGEAAASFVPRALWIIGGDGRVDLITRSGTAILVYDADVSPPSWKLVDRNRRTQSSNFDRPTFLALLEAQ